MANVERKLEIIERWFDGDASVAEAAQALLASDPACAAHCASLERMRGGVEAVQARASIDDAQFAAFFAGISERVREPRPSRRGFWGVLSLTAASLVMAVSLFFTFTGGQERVQAGTSEVVEFSTELEGAHAQTFTEDDAVWVWVDEPSRDM